MRKRSLSSQVASLFKPWFVRRPNGGCQVLFPLTELDALVAQIIDLVKEVMVVTHDEVLEMADAMRTYGGGFVKALAECFVRADEEQLQRLVGAFPDLVQHYKEVAANIAARRSNDG